MNTRFLDFNPETFGNEMMTIVRIFLHLSPIVPLWFGHIYAALALSLFVGLCYIKVFKLQAQAREQDARGDSKRAASLRKTQLFWKNLTFLQDS